MPCGAVPCTWAAWIASLLHAGIHMHVYRYVAEACQRLALHLLPVHAWRVLSAHMARMTSTCPDATCRRLSGSSRSTLLWAVGLTTFFMSSVLDNLTTTIVMVSVLQKLCADDPDTRRFLGAVVVIAANAGEGSGVR